MKIVIVGGTGTIGKAVVKELSQRHEIIVAAFKHGDIQVDITDKQSIEKMYQITGKVDGIVATTGNVHFGELLKLTEENYQIGLKSKLMGQVNLVLCGMKVLNDGGSFTLTSGILSIDPVRYGSSASMVDAAINGFVIAAAIELTRDIRINAVSPTVLSESMYQYEDYFHGFEPVSAHRVALAYSKSVEGLQTGQIYCVK